MHLHASELASASRQLVQLLIWLTLVSALFVPLERLFALKRQTIFRPQFLVDLGYYFLNGLLVSAAISGPLSIVAWAAHHIVPWSVQTTIAHLPLFARAMLALIVGEIGYYWGHRLSHEIPVLWRFHAVHHSSRDMDFLVNIRGHPVDIIIARLFTFVPIYILDIANPLSASGNVLVLAVLAVGAGWSYFIHANVRWRLGPLEWIVATPAFHHWHHTRTGHINRNYSTMLPWIDRIFGTLYLPKAWPETYGITESMPPHLLQQLMNPLRSDEPAPAVEIEQVR